MAELSQRAQDTIAAGEQAHVQKLTTAFILSEHCHTSVKDFMAMSMADLQILLSFLSRRAEKFNQQTIEGQGAPA